MWEPACRVTIGRPDDRPTARDPRTGCPSRGAPTRSRRSRGWSKTRIAVVLVLGDLRPRRPRAASSSRRTPRASRAAPSSGIGDLIAREPRAARPRGRLPAGHSRRRGIVFFDVSITNTIVTTWLVIAVVLLIAVDRPADACAGFPAGSRTSSSGPRKVSRAGRSPSAATAPAGTSRCSSRSSCSSSFSNWSGLIPLFGKIEFLRAPTSDVNVTLGLALVVFVYFQYQGFRALGVRGYLGKFFVFSGFKEGSAAGLIGLFVGLIEFMLEFIKPITLAMRLFGNIFGGEVALGVITALTIVVVPVAFLLLEGLLNFVQALIFSTLMLMYTIIAVESHTTRRRHAANASRRATLAPAATAAASPAH